MPVYDEPALRATLGGQPMGTAEWKERLRMHRRFLASLTHAEWHGSPSAGTPAALDLSGANLTDLDLSFADLPFAVLRDILADGVCCRGAVLKSAVLTDASLVGTDFSLALLEAADFARASLRGANFRRANLTGANFAECDLSGADFSGATLSATNFAGATLAGAKGLEEAAPVAATAGASRALASIVERFRADGFELEQQLLLFERKHGRETLLAELIRGLRDGSLPLATVPELWAPLTESDATALYDADDFARLVTTIASASPDGYLQLEEGVRRLLWSPPLARVSQFKTMLGHKHAAQDAGFFAELVALRSSLPAPMQAGIGADLVELGYLQCQDLPQGLLETAAAQKAAVDGIGWQPIWPEDVWTAAVVKEALSVDRIDPHALQSLAEHVTSEQLVVLASKSTSFAFSLSWDTILNLQCAVGASWQCWEDGVRRLHIGPDNIDAATVVVSTMLLACANAGREPADDLDAALAAFVTHYRPRSFDEDYQQFQDALRASFDTLSSKRREQIVLDAGVEFSWDLAPIASTPRVAQRVVERLRALGTQQSESDPRGQLAFEERLAGGCPALYGEGALCAFGPEVLPVFEAALEAGEFPQRALLQRATQNITSAHG